MPTKEHIMNLARWQTDQIYRMLLTGCMFTLFVYALPLDAQQLRPKFQRISTDDGLSNSVINTILQDRQGLTMLCGICVKTRPGRSGCLQTVVD